MKTPPLFLLSLAAVFLVSPSFSAPPLPVPRPDQTSSAAELFKSAKDDLMRGRNFESAAARLRGAVKVGPDEFRFHVALADALVSRAASLSYAEMYTKMLTDSRAAFPGELKDWRQAQSDPKSDDYGTPEPVLPPTLSFPTKDDGKPLKLSPAQAALEISRRALDAMREWDRALEIARTPGEKAEAQNARGWGLRLLKNTGTEEMDGEGGDAAKIKTDEPPTVTAFRKRRKTAGADAVKAFEDAVKLAPENAEYWQGLGDAVKSNGADLDSGESVAPRVIDAYQKSLKLKPKNAPLWYRVSSLLAQTDPKASEDALRKAAVSDAGNAYPFYQLASIHIKQTQFDAFLSSARDPGQKAEFEKAQAAIQGEKIKQTGRQAIDDIERGNAASEYHTPVYTPPIPKTLRAAWSYFMSLDDSMDFTGFANLRSLARAAGGYATDAAPRDFPEAARACRASIGLGLKISGDWPTRDSGPGDGSVIQTLVGIAVVAIGYKTWEDLAGKYGDAAAKVQVTAEYDALKAKTTAYKAAVTKSLMDGVYANY